MFPSSSIASTSIHLRGACSGKVSASSTVTVELERLCALSELAENRRAAAADAAPDDCCVDSGTERSHSSVSEWPADAALRYVAVKSSRFSSGDRGESASRYGARWCGSGDNGISLIERSDGLAVTDSDGDGDAPASSRPPALEVRCNDAPGEPGGRGACVLIQPVPRSRVRAWWVKPRRVITQPPGHGERSYSPCCSQVLDVRRSPRCSFHDDVTESDFNAHREPKSRRPSPHQTFESEATAAKTRGQMLPLKGVRSVSAPPTRA